MTDIKITFRLAEEKDLPAIVEMLADDRLGSKTEEPEQPFSEAYTVAFSNICDQPNHELIVAEFDKEMIATFKLVFIYSLTRQGTTRVQVESLRVKSGYRGKGFGSKIFEYIKERAKDKNCNIIQLTVNKQRSDAIRFYEKLGFVFTHEGMKLNL